MLKNDRALIAAFFASISYAFVPILLRYSEGYVSANSVIFNRAWIGAVSLALFKVLYHRYRLLSASPPIDPVFTKERTPINDSSFISRLPLTLLPTLLWVALPFFGTQMLWAWSISQTTVASSEILHSLSPPITALASWVLFSQVFERRFILGVILSTLGTVAIFVGDMSSVTNFRGDGLALVSALFYAAYLMAVEKLREQWGALETAFWGLSSTALLSAFVVWVVGDAAFASSWNGWLSLVLCGLDASITILLINYALKSLSSALTATILLISPCLTALLGWSLFSEALSWLNICGFIVVLVGIYCSVSSNSKIIDETETSQAHKEIVCASQELQNIEG